MAGRTVRSGAHQQRVSIAVGSQLDELQPVPARLTLGPELVPATAVERHPAGGAGALDGLPVHVAQHEHPAGAGVLYHRGHEAAFRIEVQVHWEL